MSEQIFRKKSLERVQSPEDMNDYIRVCGAGVWILLIAVLVLLIGFCIWAFVGEADITVPAQAEVENGAAVCSVEENIDDGMSLIGLSVRVGDAEGVISGVRTSGGVVSTCKAVLFDDVPDGVYSAEIVRDSVHPVIFILN